LSFDGFIISLETSLDVIPAKAGIQCFQLFLDACLVWLKKAINKKRGVWGARPPKTQFNFTNSVKPYKVGEEKDPAVGFEPVAKYLPSARQKSVINLVHDTGC
jgi:hypothetical protein